MLNNTVPEVRDIRKEGVQIMNNTVTKVRNI